MILHESPHFKNSPQFNLYDPAVKGIRLHEDANRGILLAPDSHAVMHFEAGIHIKLQTLCRVQILHRVRRHCVTLTSEAPKDQTRLG